MPSLVDFYNVTKDYITIKFIPSVKSTTLINDNFTLYKLNINDATPTEELVPNAFKEIDILKDYASISRTIFLWWDTSIDPNEGYRLQIDGVEAAIGTIVFSEDIEFITPVNMVTQPPPRPSRDPVDVEDYSIKNVANLFPGASPSVGGITQVIGTSPKSPNESYYLMPTANQGRIDIAFSEPIAANFVNSVDFKLQKKNLEAGMTQWINVDTHVGINSDSTLVSIYLPSQDATPVYSYQVGNVLDSDYIFWECGYKYRLIINPEIGL